MHRFSFLLLIPVILLAALPLTVAAQQLTLVDQFSSSGTIGLAFDAATDTVWTYSSDTLRQYSRAGILLNTFSDAPGESANDADLDFADVSFTLGTTTIPAGTLLFTNGETDVAEVYALNGSAEEIGSLTTAFGNSHVVGSAYSPARGTLFLLQDGVPAADLDNLVAEIDPVTGAVLNSFDLDIVAPDFDIFFGDLEVGSDSGDLFLLSSSESTILQLSPTGAVVQELTLAPGSGGSLSGSGIAIDDARNEIYVLSGFTVSRFAAFPAPVLLGDVNLDGVADFLDISPFISILSTDGFQDEADINRDGVVDFLDISPFISILSAQ